ncbi:hypothetical protein DFH94DRAFT_722534 [Russula ochroleuca]|uniref:Uncharacterized protein n=1 Tax=Russula ochroleuca TaxID=152965 RepID=A0A9P5N0Q6_9AGAM|nr:hypothetical protein DFH94DRAFT_722534 [Russula ochroleuca]
MREIPSWKTPDVILVCPSDNSITVRPSHLPPAYAELQETLLKIFECIGLSIPTPVKNPASYIPALSKYIEMLRSTVDSEAAARVKAETALAEERARHARILQDIQMECREPFVVPALLDAFVAISQIVDDVSDPQAD